MGSKPEAFTFSGALFCSANASDQRIDGLIQSVQLAFI